MTTKLMDKLTQRLRTLKMEATVLMDRKPLMAAALCAVIGTVLGVVIGIALN